MGIDEDFSAAAHDFVIKIIKSAGQDFILQMGNLVFNIGQAEQILCNQGIHEICEEKADAGIGSGDGIADFFYDTKDIVSVINEYDAIFKNRIAEGDLMGVFPFGRNDEGAI